MKPEYAERAARREAEFKRLRAKVALERAATQAVADKENAVRRAAALKAGVEVMTPFALEIIERVGGRPENAEYLAKLLFYFEGYDGNDIEEAMRLADGAG